MIPFADQYDCRLSDIFVAETMLCTFFADIEGYFSLIEVGLYVFVGFLQNLDF